MKLSDWQNQKWQERAAVRKERTKDFRLASQQRREQERQARKVQPQARTA